MAPPPGSDAADATVWVPLEFSFNVSASTDPDPGGTYMAHYLAGHYDHLDSVKTKSTDYARRAKCANSTPTASATTQEPGNSA